MRVLRHFPLIAFQWNIPPPKKCRIFRKGVVKLDANSRGCQGLSILRRRPPVWTDQVGSKKAPGIPRWFGKAWTFNKTNKSTVQIPKLPCAPKIPQNSGWLFMLKNREPGRCFPEVAKVQRGHNLERPAIHVFSLTRRRWNRESRTDPTGFRM